MIDLCLVSMPYAPVYHPSLALGLLKACLRDSEIQCKVLYPNIWFIETIGAFTSHTLSTTYPCHLVGEWTFAGAAFPDFEPDHSEYLREMEVAFRHGRIMNFPENRDMEILLNGRSLSGFLEEMREKATAFVDRTAHAILELEPRIVGCTSMFQQNCASLGLLRRIHELDSTVITLMGGANCESTMGRVIRREFPWVDFVISGEAEALFADFCRHLLRCGREIPDDQLPHGVIGSSVANEKVAGEGPRAIFHNLNDLPIPDYDDYFEELSRSPLAAAIQPALLLETSRGCWWGQKRRCAFCGINGAGIFYRSKSPDRALEELLFLAQRYNLRKFNAVDNILNMKYFDTFLLELAALKQGFTFFYETKANLNREQVRRLAAAGIRHIQAGIESLHDDVLRLLGKGCTVLTNLQLMKWAREMDVRLVWLMLVDVPGACDRWYSEMAELLPLIAHLEPPYAVVKIQYHRFSPYHMEPRNLGLHLSPQKWYSYVYPLSAAAIEDLAYFFRDTSVASDKDLAGSDESRPPGVRRIEQETARWQQLHGSAAGYGEPPLLRMVDDGERLTMIDTRPCAVEAHHTLEGLASRLYRLCDRSRSPQALCRALSAEAGRDVTWEEVQPTVTDLKARKLILELGGKLLSLAIGSARESLPAKVYPTGYVDWATVATLGYS